MNNLTITKAHNGLKKKEFSAVELTTFFLNKIKKQDKKIFSYITVSDELALSQAKEIDKKIAKKQDLPVLAGVPMAVKDIISVKGLKKGSRRKLWGISSSGGR